MTPSARTEAAIGLLTTILSETSLPADQLVGAWFRRRRYAGSKDRAAISGLVWGTLRRLGELDWAVRRAGAGEADARALIAAALVCHQGLAAQALAQHFSGEGYGAPALSGPEQAWLACLGCDTADAPVSVRSNVPPVLEDSLRVTFEDALVAEADALAERAPVDLRVNTLQATLEEARAALDAEGIATELTPHSTVGLRLVGRGNVVGGAAYRGGLVEVQDEGSQIAALLAGAGPG